jgi:hypothetical protein
MPGRAASDQSASALIKCVRLAPYSVSEYDTWAGTVGKTVSVNMRWEMPSMARCSSLNRLSPEASSTTTRTDQVSPTRFNTSRMPQSG